MLWTPGKWKSLKQFTGVEKDEVVFVADDFRISIKKLGQGLPDTGIDYTFLKFTPFLFFDPKLLFDVLILLNWYCVDKLASVSIPGIKMCTPCCFSVYVHLFCGFGLLYWGRRSYHSFQSSRSAAPGYLPPCACCGFLPSSDEVSAKSRPPCPACSD